jgi:hypothetical protein
VFLFPGNFVTDWLSEVKADWLKHERGSLPTIIELGVIMWVQALTLKEIMNMFKEGLLAYLMNMWNLADIFRYLSCLWLEN